MNQRDMNSHNIEMHGNPEQSNRNIDGKVYTCEDCDYETGSRPNIQKHKEDCHRNTHTKQTKPTGIFICEECGCEKETRRQIEEHMESNHQPRQNYANHKCDLCSYVAIHPRDLNRHMRTMHESFQIPRTFFSTRNQRNFQQDNEARQEPRRTQFKSGLPNSSAGNFGNSSTTSKYPHSTDQLPFPCTKCDDSFKHRDELDLHIEFFHTAKQ